MSGKSRGFGFVEMENREEAQKACNLLHSKNIDGRRLNLTLMSCHQSPAKT